MLIARLLNPKIDYVFKRIFGYIGNEEITASLLSSILKRKITNLVLDTNPILEKDLFDDKVGILDIKAKIDNSINCNIEMQITDRKDIEKRILFYWSKMYNKSVKSGEEYEKLGKNIVILISDYELESLRKIPKYVTKWNIREEEYQKVILTDVMEIYIIEVPKFSKYRGKEEQNDLNNWVEFIESPEVVNMNESNEAIKKAKEVLEEISQDEHEIYLAELRDKYIRDQKAIEGAGYDKGLKAGKRENSLEIAKKLKDKGMDINTIIEITELTKEEIENL